MKYIAPEMEMKELDLEDIMETSGTPEVDDGSGKGEFGDDEF